PRDVGDHTEGDDQCDRTGHLPRRERTDREPHRAPLDRGRGQAARVRGRRAARRRSGRVARRPAAGAAAGRAAVGAAAQPSSPENVVFGVRPAGRVPARESWRDWVYIESGWVWLFWTGGIPFAIAFCLYARRGLRATAPLARTRRGPVAIAATGAVVALAVQ